MSDRAPYQEPIPQPCPLCGVEFTPSGCWRGEVCSDCTGEALTMLVNNIKPIERTYNDPWLKHQKK